MPEFLLPKLAHHALGGDFSLQKNQAERSAGMSGLLKTAAEQSAAWSGLYENHAEQSAAIFRFRKSTPSARQTFFASKNPRRRGGIHFLFLKIQAAAAARIFCSEKSPPIELSRHFPSF